MTLKTEQLKERLNSNPDFSSSSLFFDGIILIEICSLAVWMKVFMGQVIVATQKPLPFGYTFAVKGTAEGWRLALDERKDRLREALYKGKLRVEGNTLEFTRMTKTVHGLMKVLREMVTEGLITIED
jgi:hypothetical protein